MDVTASGSSGSWRILYKRPVYQQCRNLINTNRNNKQTRTYDIMINVEMLNIYNFRRLPSLHFAHGGKGSVGPPALCWGSLTTRLSLP